MSAWTFERPATMHGLTARRVSVAAVERPADGVIRVCFGGPGLDGFTSTGPGDHVKVFVPDPVTGVLTAPSTAPDGTFVRPDGPAISRDYTPIGMRGSGAATRLDLDFMDHPAPGPATSWARDARPGDEIVLAGPRGSRAAPTDLAGLLAAVDATALPSLSRWLGDLPAGTPAAAVVALEQDETWLRGYLGAALDGVDVQVVGTGAEHLAEAVRARGPVGEGVFVVTAGEATAITAVRRLVAREFALPAAQYAASGYWRRGVTAFDHHTPLDD